VFDPEGKETLDKKVALTLLLNLTIISVRSPNKKSHFEGALIV
jgi:hypothetical protein